MGRCAVFGTRLRTKRSRGRGHLVPPAATAMSAGRFLTQQSELLDRSTTRERWTCVASLLGRRSAA